jgi:plastocyanin
MRKAGMTTIAAILALGVATGSASAAKVEVENFDFKPKRAKVDAGEKVRWKGTQGSHTVTFEEGRFDKEIEDGDRVSRKFKKSGTYNYFCSIHKRRGMKGKVVVGNGGGGHGNGGGGNGGGSDDGGDDGSGDGSYPPIVAGPGAASTSYATPTATTEVGGPLTFMNLDFAQHDVISEEKGSDGKPLFSTPLINLGESAEIEGLGQVQSGKSYGFFCSLHPGMRGTLNVR